ncbi:class I SAM-dependent methyltransferase [Pyruvatibacter sp. HU-CL02332]|uniref:class I SAM-dependent methyltransferase n=1 Tax=Pyruvatibacter sp. HU-CL02332 TaxID=3127650 RepID=UPI0031095FF7
MSDASAPTGDLMDSIYHYQRHFYDLTRKYYLLGRDRLIRELEPPQDGSVLEVGCGTGRNLIKAARRYPHAQFFGLDISEAMLEKAQSEIDRAGLGSRITLAQADGSDFDPQHLFGRPVFDRVFFSYSISMIPAWEQALACGYAATSDDGRLLVVDFGQQKELPRWFSRLLTWWLKQFHVTPRSGLNAVVGSYERARVVPMFGDYARMAEISR